MGISIFVWAIVLTIYFIPAMLATGRKATHASYIRVLNLLTGWTIIGWIAAFIWAVVDEQLPPKPVLQVQSPSPLPVVPIEKAPVRIKYVHHGR
jgi:hypothetical protein